MMMAVLSIYKGKGKRKRLTTFFFIINYLGNRGINLCCLAVEGGFLSNSCKFKSLMLCLISLMQPLSFFFAQIIWYTIRYLKISLFNNLGFRPTDKYNSFSYWFSWSIGLRIQLQQPVVHPNQTDQTPLLSRVDSSLNIKPEGEFFFVYIIVYHVIINY